VRQRFGSDFDAPTIADFAGRRRSRRQRLAGVGSVVAVVVAVAAATLVLNGDGQRDAPIRPTLRPVTHPRADAIERVRTLRKDAPLPPGAQRSRTPIAATRYRYGAPGATLDRQIRNTTWWTAPGTTDRVAGYLHEHAPDGMSGPTSFEPGATWEAVTLTRATGDEPQLELDYAIAPYRSGVAIRMDVWTTWTPKRPNWSYIRGSSVTVDAKVTRHDEPAVERTLTGDAVRQLADAINAMPSIPLVFHSCPTSSAGVSNSAVFHTSDGRLTVTGGDGCEPLSISSPEHHDVLIGLGGDFQSALLHALGLPANYGWH
jgi:hypothetical protein